MLLLLFFIELGDGHYWANDDLRIDIPLRFVGDEHNPSNVVIEMSGSIVWNAGGGFCEGITFRRPKLTSGEHLAKEILRMAPGSRLDMVESVLDNEGSDAYVVAVQRGKGTWKNVVIRNGRLGVGLEDECHFKLQEVSENMLTVALCIR